VALPFLRLEGPHLFLGHADDDDAFTSGESGAVFRHKGILTLAAFKRDDRNPMEIGERLDGGDEAIVSWFDQGGRRHGVAEIVVEEVAQAAGRLELGHIGVQIHAVNAPDLERHVVTDNVGDVGRHRDLLSQKSDEGTPAGARRSLHRSQHPLFQSLVHNGVNGYTFEAGAIQTLAARLIELLTDQTKREAMGQESLEMVAYHNIENTVDACEGLYDVAITTATAGTSRKPSADAA
jgi:hypothetical protein